MRLHTCKKITSITLFSLLVLTAFGQPRARTNQTITGFAHGFNDSTWLYLDEATQMGSAIDSVMVLDERFYFEIEKTPTTRPRQFAIRTKSFSDYKLFWMEGASIMISGRKGKFKDALVEGSEFQREIDAFLKTTSPVELELDSLRRNFGNTDSLIWNRILELEKVRKETIAGFLKVHNTSLASAHLLKLYCRELGLKTSKDLFHRLSLESRLSEDGQHVQKFIDLTREIAVGNMYVDLEYPTPGEKPLRLSDYVKTNKYVLLEFWASWCGPCRRENPLLVELYDQYRNKGLEIFAVSNDVNLTAWKNASRKDKISWPNVNDFKNGANEASLIYGVYQIPSNFLIDANGKVIAMDLRGADLTRKLKQLLGE